MRILFLVSWAISGALALPTTQIPGSLTASEVPQFVVLGSDDNFGGGQHYMLDLLDTLKNPAGSGNPLTFDGQSVSMSFYSNAVQDFPYLRVRAYKTGFEEGNHTYDHVNMALSNRATIVTQITENDQYYAATTTSYLNLNQSWKLDTLKLPYKELDPSGQGDTLWFQAVGTKVDFLASIGNLISNQGQNATVYVSGIGLPGDSVHLASYLLDTVLYSSDSMLVNIHIHHFSDSVQLNVGRYVIRSILPMDTVFSYSYVATVVDSGIPKAVGFRAPYLSESDTLYQVLDSLGYRYDCTLEDGWESQYSSTQMPWPYSLKDGDPARNINYKAKQLWEVPLAPYWIPTDSILMTYGAHPGTNARLDTLLKNGRITSLDYNMYFESQADTADLLAIYEYNLDQRLAGNHAPLSIGIHGQYYGQNEPEVSSGLVRPGGDWILRQFVKYALSKPQVRLVSNQQLLNWVQAPSKISSVSHPANNATMKISNGVLSTLNGQSIHSLEIFNIQGRFQLQQNLSGQTSVALPELASGIWWIRTDLGQMMWVEP